MRELPPLDPGAVMETLARLGLDEERGSIEIELNDEHSNSLARVRFESGRMLVIKRARYAALARRFDTSVEASRLLREQTDLLTPDYLELPDLPGEPPLLVYWWIPNPTLERIWGELDESAAARALSECGRLMRRIHAVRLTGHGALLENQIVGRPLDRFLEHDLLERLLPAVAGSWAGQFRNVRRLHRAFTERLSDRESPEAVFVHNDLFAANVLCSRDAAEFHCVGIIDFEDCLACPPEADLAKTELLHGPLFGRPLFPGWFDRILSGYGREVDGPLVALFRVYHLLNMGYHAAMTGLQAHADEVGGAIDRELARWHRGERHAQALA